LPATGATPARRGSCSSQRFDRDTIAGLVRTGLATTQRAILKAGDKVVEVARITITKAGRQAIEG
jgi:hypothetical protein